MTLQHQHSVTFAARITFTVAEDNPSFVAFRDQHGFAPDLELIARAVIANLLVQANAQGDSAFLDVSLDNGYRSEHLGEAITALIVDQADDAKELVSILRGEHPFQDSEF